MIVIGLLSAFSVGWLCCESKILRDFRRDPTGTTKRLWNETRKD